MTDKHRLKLLLNPDFGLCDKCEYDGDTAENGYCPYYNGWLYGIKSKEFADKYKFTIKGDRHLRLDCRCWTRK